MLKPDIISWDVESYIWCINCSCFGVWHLGIGWAGLGSARLGLPFGYLSEFMIFHAFVFSFLFNFCYVLFVFAVLILGSLGLVVLLQLTLSIFICRWWGTVGGFCCLVDLGYIYFAFDDVELFS